MSTLNTAAEEIHKGYHHMGDITTITTVQCFVVLINSNIITQYYFSCIVKALYNTLHYTAAIHCVITYAA